MKINNTSITIKDLTAVLKEISHHFDSLEDYIDVRLQVIDGGWEVWTGDSQYDTDHRGYWGVSSVSQDQSIKELRDIAKWLLDDATDHYCQSI